jgi:hypothetical protein
VFPRQAAEIIQDAWRDYAAKKKADAAKVKDTAVRRIQKVWKGYMYEKGVRTRCAPLVKAWINNAATTIQKAWRKYAESREYAEKKKIDAWLRACCSWVSINVPENVFLCKAN